jgi:tryptophanyl-tRNA synthetase
MATFKKEVADAVIEEMTPFKARYEQIIADKSYLEVLREGAKKASVIANATLKRVQNAVGLLDIDEH